MQEPQMHEMVGAGRFELPTPAPKLSERVRVPDTQLLQHQSVTSKSSTAESGAVVSFAAVAFLRIQHRHTPVDFSVVKLVAPGFLKVQHASSGSRPKKKRWLGRRQCRFPQAESA